MCVHTYPRGKAAACPSVGVGQEEPHAMGAGGWPGRLDDGRDTIVGRITARSIPLPLHRPRTVGKARGKRPLAAWEGKAPEAPPSQPTPQNGLSMRVSWSRG